jgi:putative hydrolase of the HAD superfamily
VTFPIRSRRRRPTALLLDFDGVLRHFDESTATALEARAGLSPGTLLTVGMAPERVVPAVLGQVSGAEWRESIVTALLALTDDPAVAVNLVEEWSTYRGDIDASVRAFVRDLRAQGVPVALCTNATDELRDDLVRFELADAFDAVINSAEIGVAKPHPDFYAAACAALSTPAEDCLFVDDTRRNVAGARAAGLLAYRYSGAGDLGYLRGVFAHR